MAKWPSRVLSLYYTIYFHERKFHLTNCFIQIPRIVSLSVYLSIKLIPKSITLIRRWADQTWVKWPEQGLGQTCLIIWVKNKRGEVAQKDAIGVRRTHSWQVEIRHPPHFLKTGTYPENCISLSTNMTGVDKILSLLVCISSKSELFLRDFANTI